MEYLIDYMAAGSTVAKLMFALGVTQILKSRNASFHSIAQNIAEAQEQADQARERILKHAWRVLGKEAA